MENNTVRNSENIYEQIFKFGIVGGIATVIDWTVYYILYNFCGFDPLIANVFSFAVSVVYNYIASVRWVFNVDNSKSKSRMFFEFMLFSIIGLLLTEALLFLFINKLTMNEMLSKIIATAIVMIFNFVTRKIFLENSLKKTTSK